MDSVLKKGLFLVTFSGAVLIAPMTARAAGGETVLPGVGIEEVLSDCYSSGKEIEVEDYLVPTEKGEYLDMAFANVQTFLYIRSEPTKDSEWVGKLYPDYAAEIMGPVGEWTKVRSGNVTGYVCSKYITIGNKAEEKVQEIVADIRKEKQKERRRQKTQDTGGGTQTEPQEGLQQEEVQQEELQQEELQEVIEAELEETFTYAESREEEEARIKKEAEERKKREEEARKKREKEAKEKAGSGQAVVAYARQFLGNPYVWGGTSLTNGADCSGFVQSVFRHFGVALPRTSGEMRSYGRAVSYSEAIPGDIVCYDGHVGIYAGNGEIVNALNQDAGIVMTPATYTSILTVRRIL